MLSNVKKITVPPYWVSIAIGIIFVAYGVFDKYMIMTYDLHARPRYRSELLIVFGALYLLKSCFHYSFCDKGIVIRFLWIPIVIIKWKKVSTAQYLTKWCTSARYGDMKGQGIFVTLSSCPVFSPGIDGVNTFQLMHPFSCFFIRFSSRHRKRYVECFRYYYSDLEFQNNSDLVSDEQNSVQ